MERPGMLSRLRLTTLLGCGCLLALLAASCAGGGTASPSASPSSASSSGQAAKMVVAWNPSHQDDTGGSSWHEYKVCGDIAKRAMALLPGFTNVLCWQPGMGQTSSGTAALTAECDQANAAHAQVFIAVHVNGGGPSGVAGCYYAGDTGSGQFAEAVLRDVAAAMDMKFLLVRARGDLFVLNPVNDEAPIRILLELGDNVADRSLLTSSSGRQRLAAALAKAVKKNLPSTFRYQQNSARLAYAGDWNVTQNESASSGSYRLASAAGATLTAKFSGTSLAWIAAKGPSWGQARVTVDGGQPVTVDLYEAAPSYDEQVWSTGTLSQGSHTVTIAWTGEKNAAATATDISVDALDVVGTIQ